VTTKRGLAEPPVHSALGNDAAGAAPAVAGRPQELLEAPRRLAGGFALLLGGSQFTGNLGDQPLEAAFLMPVQRVVGGIQIHNDLLGRVLARFQEQIDK
jgi:hypothetical protein